MNKIKICILCLLTIMLFSCKEDIANYMYAVNTDAEGLVAYWKFDEGNGNTITDYSGNNTSITPNSALKWISVSLPEK